MSSTTTLAELFPVPARTGVALATVVLTYVLARYAPTLSAPIAAEYGLLLAAGVVSGFLSGMLGIGGALITVPVLYVALPGLGVAIDQVPATAVATALMAMAPTTILGAWGHHSRGSLELAWLRRLVAPMSVGACLGVLAATWLNGPLLALMFAAQCLYNGGRLVCSRGQDEGASPRGSAAHSIAALGPWAAGSAVAAFCACVGMGGGSMTTRYLQLRGVAFRRAVATSSALNLCIALGGSLAFQLVAAGASTPSSATATCWPAAVLLGGGAMLAVSAGVAVAHRLKAASLGKAVGAMYVVSAVALVIKIVHG
jgi:uncharacterized membrane protein YfcA